METLENYLEKLQSMIDSQVADPEALVKDLKTLCVSEISHDEQDMCSSLLFASDNNILKFLKKSVPNQDKDYVKTREGLLLFTAEYIKLIGKRVQEYALDIKDTCFSLFRREQSNLVKIASFKPLIKLLELKLQLLDPERLAIREMTEIYLREFTGSKASQTVKALILELLGIFCENFPQYMVDKSKHILLIIMDSLHKQFKSKKPDMQIIAGAFKGLRSFLVNFSSELSSDNKSIASVYQYLCLTLEPPPHLVRYNIPKAGLKFLATHAELLREYLTEDSERMYARVIVFCKHQNSGVRSAAFPALDAFFTKVSAELVKGARSQVADQDTFKFFMRKFHDISESQSSSMYEITISILGYGRFASSIQQFLGFWELKKLLSKLFQFTDRMSTGVDQIDISSHLGGFISSFADIILQLDSLDDTHIENLEKILGAVFMVYNRLSYYQRVSYHASISRLFIALYSKGSSLQVLLSRIVLQGLLLSCSRPFVDASTPPTSSSTATTPEIVLWEQYLELWKQLLNPIQLPELQLDETRCKEISSIVYNELIQAIIQLIQKLDLGYTTEQNNDAVKPKNPKDFDIFLHLVDFVKSLLLSTHQQFFVKWVYLFSKELVVKSSEHPLVSGFYKLLTVALRICEKQAYFDKILGNQISLSVEESEDMQTEEKEQLDEMNSSYVLFSKFHREVLGRLEQYKDELLASCIEFVLSVPKQFIELPRLIPAIQTAFKIGLTYLPLAKIGLSALEYWIRVLPRNDVNSHLHLILPSLNDYLLISIQHSASINKIEEGVVTKKSKYSKKAKQAIDPQEAFNRSAAKVQFRIIRLLGKLGGSNYKLIPDLNLSTSNQKSESSVANVSTNESISMAWDNVKRIKFAVPFKDMKPDMYLDVFLPRVVELAEGSNDRSIKIAACELLHSLVLYMIGISSSRDSATTTPLKKIYDHVFPSLIRLATDIDAVTKQLFEPLLFQLIHWFTKNSKYENEETMSLLDAIVSSANSSEGSKRDFSAKCIAEFLRWSLKHSTQKQQEKNPFNAKSLFKRLYSLSKHPNPYKRLSAALSFEQIYRVFREEDPLVEQFTLEILHNLILSLRLCNQDDPSIGSADKITSVIRNYSRIVTVKTNLLLPSNAKRRGYANLSEFVEWLFSEIGRHENRSRAECMSLISSFVPLLSQSKSLSNWMQQKVSEGGIDSIISRIESFDNSIDSSKLSNINVNLDRLNHWFQSIVTGLDCYIWLFQESLIAPNAIFKANSHLLEHLKLFISKVSLLNKNSKEFKHLTPRELEMYHRNKSTVLLGLIKFVLLFLEKYNVNLIESILSKQFYEVVVLSLLSPLQLGFNVNETDELKYLHSTIISLLKLFINKLEKDDLQVFADVLKKVLSREDFNLFKISVDQSHLNIQDTSFLIRGYQQLHHLGLLLPNYVQSSILAESLLDNVFDNAPKYASSPVQLSVAADLLTLTFDISISPQHLLNCLLDVSIVDTTKKATITEAPSVGVSLGTLDSDNITNSMEIDSNTNENKNNNSNTKSAYSLKNPTKGELFYTTFKSQINAHLIKEISTYAKHLLSSMHKHQFVFSILLSMIEELGKSFVSKTNVVKQFLQQLFLYSGQLSSWCKEDSSQLQKSNILELLRRLVQLDTSLIKSTSEGVSFIYNSFNAFMARSIPLAFKVNVLSLLPFLLSLSSGPSEELQTRLNELVIFDFPTNSKDLPKGSSIYTDYCNAIEKLLLSLEQTSSLTVLQALFPILREQDHIYEHNINLSLSKFIQKVDDRKGKDAFELSFIGFLAKEHQDELRLALITKLCVPLIQKLSVDMLVQIISEKLGQLTGILANDQFLTDAAEKKTYLMEKMGVFKLIEIFYKRLPGLIIKERLNKLYYDKSDAKGNELTTFLMKTAHQAKSEQITVDEEHLTREFCLQYHQSAYNALASVILATQTKENFFPIFLFKESLEKNEKLWENIVDTQAAISFPVETKFPVARKIVESFRVVETPTVNNHANNMQYLSSQYLADSSLSQDVSQSTFFKATSPIPLVATTSTTSETSASSEEEIELDEYNSNSCMMTILQVLDHLQSKFGNTYDKQEMPKWMFELHTKFTTTSSPNVILFILKIIINKPDYFVPYATYWIKPILRNVTSGVVGEKFNYFLRDICILFLKWNVIPKDSTEEKQLYSQFMNHLIKNCAYHDREIVKSNLTLFKLFTEKWKGKFTPSKKILLDMLTAEASGKTNNLTHLVGIQLLDIILLNGYSLYDSDRDHDVSEFKLLTSLVNNLSFPAKEVYCAAAGLCGLALRNLENDAEKENTLAQMLRDKINYFFSKTEYDRALNCLWNIGGRFPEFLQLFYLKVFSILPSLVGQFKGVALDLILLNAGEIPDLFDRIKPELESIVQHHDPSQTVVLKILMSLLNQKKITESQISGLYQSLIVAFSSHSNVECRALYYDILIWIYENTSSLRNNASLLSSLLKGLTDDQDIISTKLYQFWDKHLPQDTLHRLLQVLGSLYSTDTESHWVHYTTSLVLELTHKSTDFERTLFEPLDEGEFKEMHIDTTKTISSSVAMDIDSTASTQTNRPSGVGIRATQASEFSLLQQPSSDSVYSSMVIDPSINSENLRQNAVVTIPYIPPSLSLHSNNAPTAAPTGLKLRRRFEPIQTMSKSTMYKELAMKKRKDVSTKFKQSRSNQVTIYRKYRSGELPDIQIKFKDIIIPLESLIKKDSTLAKLVFTNLFQCIYSTVSDKEKPNVEQNVQECLAKLLGSSNCTNTPFVATLLSIAIDNPQFITVPSIIATTSSKSFNFHTGIILLERIILYLSNLEANKKKKLSKEEKQHIWSQLAKLYRKIGEDDILRGIFEKELAKHPYTKDALSLELKGDYNEAFSIYEKAIQELDAGASWTVTPTPFEEEQWETARLECLLNLTRWQDLAENTLAHVDNNTDDLWKENMQDPYLSYYIQSNIRLKDRWPDLWEFLETSTTEHRELLEKKFAAELAFVSIIRNDLGKSRHYVNKFYEIFLADWSKLHGYDTAGKHMKLQSLQKVVELDEFLNFVANEKNFNSLQPLEVLLANWHPRYPSSQLDNIVIWDNIVTYRAVLLEKFNDRYTLYWNPKEESPLHETHQVNLGNLKSQLIDERANIYREMATAARKQHNFFVADSYLKLSLKAMTKKKEFMFPFFHSLVKLYCVKAKASNDSIQNKMEKYVKAFKFTDGKRDEPIISERADYNRKYLLVLADIYQQLATISMEYPDALLDSLEQNSLQGLISQKKNLTENLFIKAFKSFESATQLSKNNSSLISSKSASKSYLDFGLFCDHLLRIQEEGEFKPHSSSLDTNSLSCIVIKCILDSMLYNSAKARDRFPRLLEILAKNKNEETKEAFVSSVSKVPSWMFLPWLAQILGSMNQPYEASLVLPILMQVAKSYPQALYYPFKITSESLTDAAIKLVKPIAKELCKNSLLDTFVASLDKLTQPEHRFKDTMESLKPLMRASKRDNAKILSIISQLYEDVLDKSPNAGSYNAKFATTWEKSIVENFGKDGGLLLKMDNDAFLTLVADFNVTMSKSLSSIKTSKWKLSDFSGWLSSYDHSDQLSADVMEIPGQYTGLSKPIPDTHIKITSFDAMILIMGSLRKPKRLKIHGNDERDYPFLVKGGEDLRLDQRVQQLFSVMNQILLQDNAAAKRNLKIKTYQVIPMTTKVGMIQWLENTKPLKEIIEEELSKHEGKKSEILKGSAAALFDSWIKSFANRIKSKSKGPCELFYAMYQYASRPEVEKQINKQQNTLPHDLLQRGIASLSSSPETYLFIRSQFAKTLAVFNIASYIVGIGDRHLENFLLDMSSGSLIGIDFGHAFGTATQFLPIPELIPFRLTRQLTQFLHPLDSEGLLKHNMVYTLSALQENQEVLLNTMDVFVKEPLLDWEKLARRVAKDQGGEEQENPTAWFPKKKIDVVKRKLQKTNPAYITYSELQEKSVHSTAPYLKALQQVVLGDPSANVRARVKEKCHSTMEQVECLIDQATDPNILGRTYNGWAPWV